MKTLTLKEHIEEMAHQQKLFEDEIEKINQKFTNIIIIQGITWAMMFFLAHII